jgi:hypothetical protein
VAFSEEREKRVLNMILVMEHMLEKNYPKRKWGMGWLNMGNKVAPKTTKKLYFGYFVSQYRQIG